jgi:hypothetical protein
MFLSWTHGIHEPPGHTEESRRNERIWVNESGNDLGTIAPKHQGKRDTLYRAQPVGSSDDGRTSIDRHAILYPR